MGKTCTAQSVLRSSTYAYDDRKVISTDWSECKGPNQTGVFTQPLWCQNYGGHENTVSMDGLIPDAKFREAKLAEPNCARKGRFDTGNASAVNGFYNTMVCCQVVLRHLCLMTTTAKLHEGSPHVCHRVVHFEVSCL